MDVESIVPNEQQFVVLLGKKYPVIICRDDSNLTSTINTASNLPSNVMPEDIATSSAIVVETVDPSSSNVQFTDNDVPVPISQLEIQSSSGLSVSEAINPNESCSSEGATEPATVTEEHLMEDENASGDLSPDDAVALALTINEEGEQQSFHYEIKPDDRHGAATEDPDNPIQVQNQSSSEEPTDTTRTPLNNLVAESNQDSMPISDSGITVDVIDSSADAIEEQSLENAGLNQFEPDQSEMLDESGLGFSVSSKLNILDYAQSEWKGTTYTAKCLRNGYQMLIKNTDRSFMRQIRGDNYCALRATTFQILSQNTNILSSHPDWKMHLKELPKRLLNDYKCTWLGNWSFADRLQSTAENRFNIMQDCLDFFVEQKELSNAMQKDVDRVAHFTALFNSGSSAEIKLFEAIKLLMLDTAVNLHQLQSRGEEVPIFAWLLFARDTSETPESLMVNHLNPAGKSGGLEQVLSY